MNKKPKDNNKLISFDQTHSIKTVAVPKDLVRDLRDMIEESRWIIARTVNTTMVDLYWRIGQRIRVDILKEKRARYGEEIVSALSRQLTDDFGRGFSKRNLFNMVRFNEVFSDSNIVQTLSAQLSWSHFVEILPLEDNLQRAFCVNWNPLFSNLAPALLS